MRIYNTFFTGLKDYTQDKRGDIGAWVREACVAGLQVLLRFIPVITFVRKSICRGSHCFWQNVVRKY